MIPEPRAIGGARSGPVDAPRDSVTGGPAASCQSGRRASAGYAAASMPTLPGESFLSRIVLGEHELLEVAREDDALTVFRSRSTVDGGMYTVALLRGVTPTSGTTEIAGAAARASRLAMGIPGLLPLLAARTDEGHVWAVRRGEPGRGADRELDRARTFREAYEIVAGAGKALVALHDISQFHGAITPLALVRVGERDLLDWAGLSVVAEASAGTRALAEVLPRAFRPPELAGDVPATVGPWSDVHAFARIVVALLAGTPEPRDDLEGLELPGPLQKALEAALSASPARRPADVGTLLAALGNAGDGRAVSGFAASRAPAPPSPEPVAISAEPDATPSAPATGHASPLVAAPNADATGAAEAVHPPPAASASGPANGEEVTAPPPPKKKRDALDTLIAASGAFALLLFVGGLVGVGVLGYRSLRSGGATAGSPTVAAPIVPVPTVGPSPTATTTPPLSPTDTNGTAPPPTPDKAPSVFAPRPSGEIATSKDDEEALLPVLADDPVRGDRRASVTMVIFADPTCPHSARLVANVPALEDTLGSSLRVVVKMYPLPERAGAADAAEAALAVRKKGGNQAFFAFLLALGKASGRVDGGSLEEVAIKAGAPAGAVTEALRLHSERARIETNVVQGRRMAVTATPVVFLNGRRFDGLLPPQLLENEIKAEAVRARSLSSRGVSPDQVYKARVFSNVTTGEADGPRR